MATLEVLVADWVTGQPRSGVRLEAIPVVVASCEERVRDKTALCEIALARLGAPGALSTALLVDNRDDNVAAFRGRGGQGYLFTDDATFAHDLPALRARLE